MSVKQKKGQGWGSLARDKMAISRNIFDLHYAGSDTDIQWVEAKDAVK